VAVTKGRKLGDLVEVSGPLKSADRLVLEPSDKLKPGADVVVSAKP
jgi:HlyD family secretion protein